MRVSERLSGAQRWGLAVGLVAMLVTGLVVVATGGVGVVVADTDYDIQIDGVVDVRSETIDAPPGQSRDSYDVDAIAVREQGESLSADITIPDDNDTSMEDVEVEFVNADQQTEAVAVPNSEGQITFDTEDMNQTAGTYSLLLVDGGIQKIYPVVISGYDIAVENPTTATEDETINIEGTITQTAADGNPTSMSVILWNEADEKRVTFDPDDNGDYSADISLSDLDPAEYNVYVTANGDDEYQGEPEILAIGEGETLTVEDAADDTDGGNGGGGSSDGGSGGSDGGGSSAGGGSGGGGGGLSPTVSTSTDINDATPGQAGVRVEFSNGAVGSVTFLQGEATGTINVEEYGPTVPPNAPDAGDRPVMQGVVVSPSEEHRDSRATMEITVDQTEVLRADATAEDLVVLRATDNGYQTLDTTVVDDDGDVTLRAETPGFSAFIVSTAESDTTASGDGTTATSSGDDAEPTGTSEATPGSDSGSDDVMQPSNGTESEPAEPEGQVGFGIIVSMLSLLLVTLLAKHRHRA